MTDLLPVLLAWALLTGPGLLLLLAAGARVPVRWGWAPPLTVLAAVLLAAVLHLLAIPWTPLSTGVGLVLLLAAVRALRDVLHRRTDRSSVAAPRESIAQPALRMQAELLVSGTCALAGIATAASAMRWMGGIDTLNGSYDSFFHLSAIAEIRHRRDATLTSALTGLYGEPTFYPVVVDALSALLPLDTIPAANAMALAMLAAQPAALAALVATCVVSTRRRPWLAVLAALTAPIFLSVPAMALVMGLWPVVLGALCLPPALAAVVLLMEGRLGVHPVPGALGVGAVLLGTALAHPTIMFSVAVFAGLIVLVHGAARLRAGQRRRGGIQVGLALAAALLFVIGSRILLEGMDLTRPSSDPLLSVLWRVLVDTPRVPVLEAPLWPVAVLWVLAVVGAVAALRRRETIGTTAVLGVVVTIVLAVATQISAPLAEALVNPWYGARERIAPLMTALLVVLMARGLAALDARTLRWAQLPLAPVAAGALVLTSVFAVAVPQRLPLTGSLAYTAYGLQLSPYVTPRERAFIERTAAQLPDDAVVLGDPRDGTPLYWSVGGVETVFPIMGSPQTRDGALIAKYFSRLDDRRQVCDALARVSPTHLYRDTSEFSGRLISPASAPTWVGLYGIPPKDLRLVEQDGPYALYEVTLPC